MLRLMSALVLALAITGCSSGPEDAIESWTDSSCGCKDAACAEKQKQAFDEIEKKYEDEFEKMDKDDQEKLEKVYRKGNECLAKFNVQAG